MGAKNKKKKENTTSKPILAEKIVEEQTQTEEIKEEIVEEIKEEQVEKTCNDCRYYPDTSACETCEGYSNFDNSWVEPTEKLEDSDLVELDLSVEEPIRQREKRPKVVIFETYNKVKDYVIKHIKKISTKEQIKEKIQSIKGKLNELTFKEFCLLCKQKITVTNVMYSITVVCIVTLGGLAVYSCTFAKPQPVVEPVAQVKETPKEQNYFVDIDVDADTTKKVYWTNVLKDDILNTLSYYNYIHIKQTADSVNKKGSAASIALTTDLAADFMNKRVYCITDMSDNIGNKHSEYFYDSLNKIYLTNTEEDGWVKSRKVAINANFDLDSYMNCADFFKFLYKDYAIAENTEGKIIDNHIHFTYTRDAEERDLTNIIYDKLDTTDIELIFEKFNDTYIPVSLIKEVTFESNDNVYSSRLVIYFDEMAIKVLDMPSYKDFSEETLDTEEETVVEEKQ